MKTADYIITRSSYDSNKNLEAIDIFEVNDTDSINSSENISRGNLIALLLKNKIIYTGKFNDNNRYEKISKVYLHNNFQSYAITNSPNNGFFDHLDPLPKQLPKRKTFVSFYHKDDEAYKEQFYNLTKDLTINKSVKTGDIDTDVSHEYIKHLIHDGYLSDTTLLIVLISHKTRYRKHIDWEISGALNVKVGDKYSGLLGILLPTHPDFNTGQYNYPNIPQRLADNCKTNYAVIFNWTNDRIQLQSMIELALDRRITQEKEIDNSRLQMQKNSCD